MKQKITFALLVFLAGGVILLRPLQMKKGKTENPILVVSKQESDRRVQVALAAIPVTSKTGSREVNRAVFEKLQTGFGYLAKARYSLHKDSEREAILARLAEDEAAVAVASKVLTDLSLARAKFGERQAEARLFSVALLEEKAKLGDSRALEETAQTLSKELAADKRASPGRLRDLEDLILAYVSVEKDTALVDLDKVVMRLGYQPELKKTFLAGIYFGLQSNHSKEEIIARLDQIGIY